MENNVHHIEFGVTDFDYFQRYFVEKYRFSVVSERNSDFAKQIVLKSDGACILITQFLTDLVKDTFDDHDATLFQNCRDDPYIIPWNLNPHDTTVHGKEFPLFSSVHNVALKVKSLQNCVNRLITAGASLIKPIRTVTDEKGEIKTATVKSCIGNVIHTLIECDNYKGNFLPYFTDVTSSCSTPSDRAQFTHFDHVTFACHQGSSSHILQWYEKCFGMNRFLINRDEDEDCGFVIDSEGVGLRLKAFEYWRCAEVGLKVCDNDSNSIKFVIAEALKDQGPNQVDTFLLEHSGPGIQHVALYTDQMVDTCSVLKSAGVEFVEPPYAYYTEVGKLYDINEIGLDAETLRYYGILVDSEADCNDKDLSNRYLMQKFTKPLFEKNTFFLEIIQRVGARGFGSGNITALWRAVQAHLSEQNKKYI